MEPSASSDAIYYPANSNKSGFASAFSFWKEQDDKLKQGPTPSPIASANSSRSRLYSSGLTPRASQTSPRQVNDLAPQAEPQDGLQVPTGTAWPSSASDGPYSLPTSPKSTPRDPDEAYAPLEPASPIRKPSEEEPSSPANLQPVSPTSTIAVSPTTTSSTSSAPSSTVVPQVPQEVVRAVTPILLADLPTRASRYWAPSADSSAPSSPITRKTSTIITPAESVIVISKRSAEKDLSPKPSSIDFTSDTPLQSPPKPEDQIPVTITTSSPETQMKKASSTVLAATNSKDSYRPLDKLIMSSTHKLKVAASALTQPGEIQSTPSQPEQGHTASVPPKLAETSSRAISQVSMESDHSIATKDSTSTLPMSENSSVGERIATSDSDSSIPTDSAFSTSGPSSSDLFTRRKGGKSNASAPGILKAVDSDSTTTGPSTMNTRLLMMMGGSQSSALTSRSDINHSHHLPPYHQPRNAAEAKLPLAATSGPSASSTDHPSLQALNPSQSSHDFWMRSDQFLLELSEGSPRSSTSTKSEASSITSSPALSRANTGAVNDTKNVAAGSMSPVSDRSTLSRDTKSTAITSVTAPSVISVVSIASSSSSTGTKDSVSTSGAGSTAGSTPVGHSILSASAPTVPSPSPSKERLDIIFTDNSNTSDESTSDMTSEATTDDSAEDAKFISPLVAVTMSVDDDHRHLPKKKKSDRAGGNSTSSSPGDSNPTQSSTTLSSPKLSPSGAAHKRSRSKDSLSSSRRKKDKSKSQPTKKEPILEEVEPHSPQSSARDGTDTDASGTMDSETYSGNESTKPNGEKSYVSIPIDLSSITGSKSSSGIDSPSSSTATPTSAASGDRPAAYFPRRDKVGANPSLARTGHGSPVSSSTPKLRVHRQYSSETLKTALTSKTETDLFATPTKFSRPPASPSMPTPDAAPATPDSVSSTKKKASNFFSSIFGREKKTKSSSGGLSPSGSKTDLSTDGTETSSSAREGKSSAHHKRRKSTDPKAGSGKPTKEELHKRRMTSYGDLGMSLQEGEDDNEYDSEMSVSTDMTSRPRGNSVAGIPISGTGHKASNSDHGTKTRGSGAGGLTTLLGRDFASADHPSRPRSNKGLSLPSSPYDSESEISANQSTEAGASTSSITPNKRRTALTTEFPPPENRSRNALTVAEPGTPTLKRRNSLDPSTSRDAFRAKGSGGSTERLDFSQFQTLSPSSASTSRGKDQKKKDKKSSREDIPLVSVSNPSSPKRTHINSIFGISLETLIPILSPTAPMSPVAMTPHPLSPMGSSSGLFGMMPSTPSTTSASVSTPHMTTPHMTAPLSTGVSPGGMPMSPNPPHPETPEWITVACNTLTAMKLDDHSFEDAFSSISTFSAKDKLLLRKSIEDGSMDISLESDAKMISQAIFTFLEDLPDPVCTYKAYADFVGLVHIDEPRYQLQLLFTIIWSLSAVHRKTLLLLVDFLINMAGLSSFDTTSVSTGGEEKARKRLASMIEFFAPTVFRSRSFSTLHISPRPFQLSDMKGMSLAQTFHALTPAAMLAAASGGSGSSSSLLSAKHQETSYIGKPQLTRRNSKLSGSLEASDTSSMDHAGSTCPDETKPHNNSPSGSFKGIFKSSSERSVAPAPMLGSGAHHLHPTSASSSSLVPSTIVISATPTASPSPEPSILIAAQTGSSSSLSSSSSSSHSKQNGDSPNISPGASSPVPRLGLEGLRKPPTGAKSQPLNRTKSSEGDSSRSDGLSPKPSPLGTPVSSAPSSPASRMSPRSNRMAIEILTLIVDHRDYLFNLESEEFTYEISALSGTALIEFGTMDYLFDLLGNPFYKDSDFASSLFVGAGQAISPEEILARVMSRVRAGDSAKDHVKRRAGLLLNALRQWVYSCSDILATHTAFFADLTTTVNTAKIDDESFLLAEILADLTIAKGNLSPPTPSSLPTPIDVTYVPPLTSPIISQSVETLAQHLMIIDLEHLKALKLRKVLTDSAADFLNSPAFVKMTSHFNTLSRWVAHEIVLGPTQKERRLRVLYFAQVAHCLVELNDYNSALAVFSGITSFSVSRMTKMMQSARKKASKYLDSLEQLFSMTKNYKAYSDRIKQCQLPAIPQIVLYARNLSSLDENNPSFEGDKMNIGKLKDFVRLAQDLLKYQKSVLYYHKDMALYNALQAISPPSDDEIEAESKRMDPKK